MEKAHHCLPYSNFIKENISRANNKNEFSVQFRAYVSLLTEKAIVLNVVFPPYLVR